MANPSAMRLLGFGTGLLVGSMALLLGAPGALAATSCERADAIAASTGRGDRDFDGLSNCTERQVLGTSQRDPDTDDDGSDDGDEVANGTNPVDADSDDDGLTDGDEDHLGTDPLETDSDEDGASDGEDADPADELDREIEGDVDALSCPGVEGNGSVTVLGISIAVTPETEFEGVLDCPGLADLLAATGGAHVEVDVVGTGSELAAEEIEIEDADHDGSPELVDDDDDDDGVEDVDDPDDDDGVLDEVEDELAGS